MLATKWEGWRARGARLQDVRSTLTVPESQSGHIAKLAASIRGARTPSSHFDCHMPVVAVYQIVPLGSFRQVCLPRG